MRTTGLLWIIIYHVTVPQLLTTADFCHHPNDQGLLNTPQLIHPQISLSLWCIIGIWLYANLRTVGEHWLVNMKLQFLRCVSQIGWCLQVLHCKICPVEYQVV